MNKPCTICQTIESKHPTIVWESDEWILRHSTETNIEGYLILEPRRHFLDFASANAKELASYGPAINMAMKAIHAVVKPYRIYTFSLAESMPHLHVHLIPRQEDMPRAWVGRGIMQYPLVPGVSEAAMPQICERMRVELKKLSLLGYPE